MAITRAQQAKQMLQDGGRIGFFTGMREQEQREKAANRREAAIQEQRRQTVDVRKSPTGSYDEAGLNVRKTGKDDDPYEGTTQMGFVDETPIIPIPRETTRDFREKKITPPKFPPGAALVTNVFKKPLQAGMTYDRNFFVDKVLKAGRIGITPLEFSKLSPDDQEEVFDDFTKLRNAGLTDAYGNLKTGVTITPDGQIIDNRDDSGPSKTIKLIPDPIDSTDPTDPNQTTVVFAGIAPAFAGSKFDFDKLRRQLEEEQSAADGGRIGADEGGIMKASYGYDDAMGEAFEEFLRLKKIKEIPADMEFDEYLDQLDIDVPYSRKDRGEQRTMAQEGGMIDMGGMEKDYRNEGGFVAIGGQERADDVPSRLSKNEFVFTADAVRNAGGGNIDKGAEIMENMMENLEAGGKVSEESQGLQGARAMFATQKRLGEVL